MPIGDFFGFLRRSMDMLATESPRQYDSLADTVAGLRAGLVTDGTARSVWFEGGRLRIGAPNGPVDLEVAFTSGTVLALLDGETSLDEAILDESLWVRGTADVVARYYAGIIVFIDGALRCRGIPPLLEQFRMRASSRHQEN